MKRRKPSASDFAYVEDMARLLKDWALRNGVKNNFRDTFLYYQNEKPGHNGRAQRRVNIMM